MSLSPQLTNSGGSCGDDGGVNEWICCFQSKTASILNSEHIIIILVIFTLILSGMCFAFVFNCTRKLIRDHRIMKVSAAPTHSYIFYLSLNAAYAVRPQWMGARVEFDSPYPLTPNRTHALSKRFLESTRALRKSDFVSVTYLWNKFER